MKKGSLYALLADSGFSPLKVIENTDCIEIYFPKRYNDVKNFEERIKELLRQQYQNVLVRCLDAKGYLYTFDRTAKDYSGDLAYTALLNEVETLLKPFCPVVREVSCIRAGRTQTIVDLCLPEAKALIKCQAGRSPKARNCKNRSLKAATYFFKINFNEELSGYKIWRIGSGFSYALRAGPGSKAAEALFEKVKFIKLL